VELEFSLYDEPVTDDVAAKTHGRAELVQAPVRVSRQEADGELRRFPPLFDQLLDVVIQVTHADKGFHRAARVGEPVVKVARNLRHETISDAVSHLSDPSWPG